MLVIYMILLVYVIFKNNPYFQHPPFSQSISKTLLSSLRQQERVYAAKSLATVGKAAPQYAGSALERALVRETDAEVRYEICKSLTTLGEFPFFEPTRKRKFASVLNSWTQTV